MNTDELFLHTLEDLEKSLEPGRSEYDVLMVAALLRKLLLDGGSLVDQVNRGHRFKIVYEANCEPEVPRMYVEDGAIFWSQQDGFDPQTSHRPSPSALSKDAMFRCVVLMTGGHSVTVHEIIDYVAHIDGAVHSGAPRTDKDKALRQMTEELRVGGMAPGTRELLAIGRVVVRGLEPLRQAVRTASAAPPGNR